ncbi:hypothetical protein GPJ56_003372 [Histomonas meleagridis]|uniref:uncharacterized protein n=1 Tax=Histomonas meleagridis TaxID=135588 RepID=UPI0035596AA2|nr:hypothetical protein GPJ56_003372 [Histomonas meleagridis]KAH0804991.1 hypothetical protein GO595_001936 [Histomonas meleagridis]
MENDQQITVKINDDETIRILASFGRENLCGVYLLGISCLARIYGLSKPKEEYAFFNSKEELKKFIQTYLNNEYSEILVDPKDGAYLCSIGESPAYLFVSAERANYTSTPIEGIYLDVRDLSIQNIQSFSRYLNSKTITMSDLFRNPVCFWSSLKVLSYLPTDFHLQEYPDEAIPLITGSAPGTLLDRTAKSQKISYGARVITDTLVDILQNYNFPYYEIERIYEDLLLTSIFPNFTYSHLGNFPSLLSNVTINSQTVSIPNIGIPRFAGFIMPLYMYAHETKISEDDFFIQSRSSNFNDFCKLQETMVTIDKSPFVAWFCFDKHCFPSWLVLPAIDICAALVDLENAEDLGEWVFNNSLTMWKEAICLLEPDLCLDCLEKIKDSGVLEMLESPLFSLNNKETQKIFGYKAMYTKNPRADIYAFLKTNPKGTVQEFRKYFQNK